MLITIYIGIIIIDGVTFKEGQGSGEVPKHGKIIK